MDTDTQIFELTNHVRLDSLPLRYGLLLDRGCKLELSDIENHRVDDKDKDAYHIDAKFINPKTNRIETGHFVIGANNPRRVTIVTIYKHSVQTERDLSTHMTKLRGDGSITPEQLVELHSYYKNGTLRSVSQLIDKLSDLKSKSGIKEGLRASSKELSKKDETIKNTSQALRKTNQALEVARKEKNHAQSAQNQAERERDKVLEKNKELSSQMQDIHNKVKATSSSWVTSDWLDPVSLIEVKIETESTRSGEKDALVLYFDDGSRRKTYWDPATFNIREGIYKKLKGRLVQTNVANQPDVEWQYSGTKWFNGVRLSNNP